MNSNEHNSTSEPTADGIGNQSNGSISLTRRRVLSGTAAGLFSFCGLGVGTTSAEIQTPRLHVEGNSLVDPDGNQVTLRGVNVADPADVQARGQDFQEILDLATDENQGWYNRVIRLPCHPRIWNNDPGYSIADYFADYIRPTVDYLATQGVYVIIDYHAIANWDPAQTDTTIEGTDVPVDTDLRAFWNYVAPRLAGETHVLFELFNEPKSPAEYTQANYENWQATAQPWVDLIRSHAPETPILIGSPDYSSQTRWADDVPFEGDNLVYVGHIYPTDQFDGDDGDTPEDHYNWDETVGEAAQEVPVMITEWGYINEPDRLGPDNHMIGRDDNFGIPFRDWLDSNPQIGWTAWCFDTIYDPRMFRGNYDELRTGNDYMGDLVKEYLKAKQDDRIPGPGGDDGGDEPAQEPRGGTPHSVPGRIQAEDFDTGGEGVAYHDSDPENKAGDRDTGVDVAGGVVGWNNPGEWREYTITAEAGTYDVTASVATPNEDATLRLTLDGETIGEVDVPNTGSWESFETPTRSGVTLDAVESGVLRMEPVNASYNIKWVEFEQTEDPGTDPGDLVSGETYKITAVHSGKALDVRDVSTEPGATVQQWEYGGGANQQWKLEEVSDGIYQLVATHSGLVLDVARGSTDAGADIQQWRQHGRDNQLWRIEPVGDGVYTIENVNSGKLVDVSGLSDENGASVYQWDENGQDNQKWRFEQV